ncbi:hypothetical protein K523DRAFT_43677 [Schizophyllum commune Tattone D]|nr:hypothetical protein K523DRAFT_43677 [Schizophyllum commune Tattone D]
MPLRAARTLSVTAQAAWRADRSPSLPVGGTGFSPVFTACSICSLVHIGVPNPFPVRKLIHPTSSCITYSASHCARPLFIGDAESAFPRSSGEREAEHTFYMLRGAHWEEIVHSARRKGWMIS